MVKKISNKVERQTGPGPGRGGKRVGSGRKAEDGATVASTVQITARVTPEQRMAAGYY